MYGGPSRCTNVWIPISSNSFLALVTVGLLLNALEGELNEANDDKNKEEYSEQEKHLEGNGFSDMSGQVSNNRKTILERWVEKFKEFLDNA